jgi:peptide/nickel transport system permease protein
VSRVARLLGRRLLHSIIVLAGVLVVSFGLLHLIPGNPAQALLGNRATPSQVAALDHRWGLDRSIPVQFGLYLRQLFLHGDTGNSLFYNVPTRELILPRLGVSLELVAIATVVCVVVTIPLATIAAVRRGGVLDQLIRIVPTVGAGMPALWIGLLLIIVFGVHLRWFPVGGAGPGPWLTFRGLILPGITAALAIIPVLVRSLRAGILEVLDADYVLAARAKSLSEPRVLLAHVARNAAVPTLTLLGLNVAYLVGGTVVVEQVFAIDGLGNLMYSALSDRDFPVVQGVALVFAAVVVVVGFATELLAAGRSPRLRDTR